MQVVKLSEGPGPLVAVVDAASTPVEPIGRFLTYLDARGASPNTTRAYAYDLRRVWEFFEANELDWRGFGAPAAVDLVVHLSARSASRIEEGAFAPSGGARLSAATINRACAAMSSFCDWAIVAGLLAPPNPMRVDRAIMAVPVSGRHRPFLEGISRRPRTERLIRVRAIHRPPRPLSEDQVDRLLGAVACPRDRALMLLMLHGGLRPGEALGLHLEDIAYGRRRVAIRCRDDHPKGARGKSQTERVVDLHDRGTLDMINAYVMRERPRGAATPFVFRVGGRGTLRHEPLSYAVLAKGFARAAERAGVRAPGVSPHALRHTHATRM